jgi:hypothetical protein
MRLRTFAMSVGAALTLALLSWTSAQAEVSIGIGIGVPGYYPPPPPPYYYYYPRPRVVYVTPAPRQVYVVPAKTATTTYSQSSTNVPQQRTYQQQANYNPYAAPTTTRATPPAPAPQLYTPSNATAAPSPEIVPTPEAAPITTTANGPKL